jgi:phytoene desaturase
MMQSGYFRPQVKSGFFDNLYFVGAGVHPGAGVPAVMASGKIAANTIDPSSSFNQSILVNQEINIGA